MKPATMATKRQSGQASRAIRWTIRQASVEFGKDRTHLTKRLRQVGEQPGQDGTYSTRQIVSAVFGDIDSKKLEIASEQAEKLKMENLLTKNGLLDKEYVRAMLTDAVTTIRQKIMNVREIPDDVKQDVLADLGAIEL